MNKLRDETKVEMILDVIEDLSDTQKIIYLTYYFNTYSIDGLKQILGLKEIDYSVLDNKFYEPLINRMKELGLE